MARKRRTTPPEQETPEAALPPPTNRAFSALLKALHLNLIQAAAKLGMDHKTLSDYAQGRKTMYPQNYRRKCAALGHTAAGERALALVEEVDGAAAPFLVSEMGRLAARLAASIPARLEKVATRRDLAKFQALWKRLKKLDLEDWKLLFDRLPGLRKFAFVKLLGEESVRAAADDATRALELANLALWLAERVPGLSGRLARIFGWAYTGNAQRVGSDLRGSVAAFDVSTGLREAEEEAGAEIPEAWRLFDLEASLRIGLRELPEAVRLLDQAARQAPRTGSIQARLLSQKACILELMEDPEGAVDVLRQALTLVDGEAEPRLLCILRFNLMENLCKAGYAAEAEELLSGLRRLTAQIGNRFDRIRQSWLEGKIAHGLGRIEEAVEVLSSVRAAFADEGIPYDEALAGVDLAELYLKQGRAGDVKRLVKQMERVFLDEDVHEEARKALNLFRRAVEMETVTVALVRRVAAYLSRARHDPELCFEEAV